MSRPNEEPPIKDLAKFQSHDFSIRSQTKNLESIVEIFLVRKTAGEGLEKFQGTFDAYFPCEQGPHQIAFFGQESQPGLAVSSQMKVPFAMVSFQDLQCLVPNDDRGLFRFRPYKGEVISGT